MSDSAASPEPVLLEQTIGHVRILTRNRTAKNGVAIGAGLALAMCADLRIESEKRRPEFKGR